MESGWIAQPLSITGPIDRFSGRSFGSAKTFHLQNPLFATPPIIHFSDTVPPCRKNSHSNSILHGVGCRLFIVPEHSTRFGIAMNSSLLEKKPVATVILDSVRDAVEKTYVRISGEKPLLDPEEYSEHDKECVAGIISFFGDTSISLAWVLDSESAPALAQQFARFPIPFESADMGDMTGELVNVLAGDVVAILENRKCKVKMSLPTVARGNRLRLMPDKGVCVSHLNYKTRLGKFWLLVATDLCLAK
jgi:chemotaxis protein CheX